MENKTIPLSQEEFIEGNGVCPSCKNPDNEQKNIDALEVDFNSDYSFQQIVCSCGAGFTIILKIINADNVIDLNEEIEYRLNGYALLCDCLFYQSNDNCSCNYKNNNDEKYYDYLTRKPQYKKIFKDY
tara:strand:+ start:1681 stop:2064 length:384 start_codon:yes stop_codon:yes gene_type:complete